MCSQCLPAHNPRTFACDDFPHMSLGFLDPVADGAIVAGGRVDPPHGFTLESYEMSAEKQSQRECCDRQNDVLPIERFGHLRR